MFRALFETAPDAMVVVDHDGRILLANPQAHALFGYAADELVGSPVDALLPEHLRGVHQEHRSRYMSRPRVRPMGAGQELVARRRDGGEFPVEIALSPIEVEGRRYYVASIRDISETHRVRQALARARYDAFVAQAGQLALESPYEAMLEALPALLETALSVDAIAIAFATPQRDALQLRAASGLPAGTLDVLRGGGDDDPLPRLFSGRPVAIDDLAGTDPDAPLAALAAAGFTSALLVPLFDAGQPMGALLALSRSTRTFDRDATHFLQSVANTLAAAVQRHRAQEQLAHSQRLDAVGQLTGGVAHDFNNLLTVISGNLQMLEAELGDRPQSQETIASALRAVGRGAELTRKLLAFARRQRLSPQALRLGPMLDELAAMLRRTLGAQVSVEIDCDAAIEVYADPAQLDAALVNLALNARDAMPRGGRLAIAARETVVEDDAVQTELAPGRYAVLSVADTGLGMAPDVLARAFEPFFTTKEPGKGSGLGLSMVYGFVRQSGGRLNVESRLGYGTRIELHLPAARSAPQTAAAATATVTPGNETVLVVEDEPEVRGIAVAFLRSLGYRVHAAAGAAAALQLLHDDPQVALLFSDVVLGSGPSGGELAREARRLRPGLAVLLTSGYERGADGDQPASEFELLRKPYRREELAAAARRALERR
jgi:PAS domain S-box-containing protein